MDGGTLKFLSVESDIIKLIYNTEKLLEAVNRYGELVKAIETPTNLFSRK